MAWPQRISGSRFISLGGSLQEGLELECSWKRIQRAPAYVTIILRNRGTLSPLPRIFRIPNLTISRGMMKMDPFDRTEPKISDYYADLGLPQQASLRDIKLAFFKLAKKHHPDKKAPGKSIDAQDFRKASL
jgi:hypothetical protein